MRKLLVSSLTLLFALSVTWANQGGSMQANTSSSSSTQNSNAKKRGPIFRANKEQVKQAQAILKQKGFYTGEQTGRLDDETRAGLKKYQAAENIKVTGTLNRVTLEKMNITLTDKQKAM
ncbi:MAG: putative peptidoglycan binding domain [Blastocatellia bacterium]|nr:putative peptidoglycan binding domain [Blastocatellia bacterium]